MTATVLLTGFEPFAGASENASWNVVHRISSEWDDGREGAHLETALLPVSFARLAAAIDSATKRSQPTLVLHLGLAGNRRRVSIERVGLNLADARIADNDGDQPIDQPLDPTGPPALFATIPVKAALAACTERGLPVEASLSAGSFLCNAALFHSLSRAERSVRRVGFVHVPMLGDGDAHDGHAPGGTPTLPLEAVAESVLTIIRTCLAHRGPDLAVVGGDLS